MYSSLFKNYTQSFNQKMIKNHGFSTEKFILGVLTGRNIDDFCELHKKSATALISACPTASTSEAEKGYAFVSYGILKMINTFCYQQEKRNVSKDIDERCDHSAKITTVACSIKSGYLTSTQFYESAVYPSDLILMMMIKSIGKRICTDSMIKNTENCFIHEMKKGACPTDIQKEILAPLHTLFFSSCEAENQLHWTDCSKKFYELTKENAFSVEKFIFKWNWSTSWESDTFCQLNKKLATALTTALTDACPMTSEADKRVIIASHAISTMIKNLCGTRVSEMVENKSNENCEDVVKTVTTTCRHEYGVISPAVYPSDLMIMAMIEYNNASLCNTMKNIKNCISSQLLTGYGCSPDAFQFIITPLNSLVSVLCEISTIIIPSVSTTLSTVPVLSTQSTTHTYSLLQYWDDSKSSIYSGCLAIEGPFNRPYQHYLEMSLCNSHFTCRGRHPGNSGAFCIKTDIPHHWCCKIIQTHYGIYYESDCVGDCSEGNHAYCAHISPAQKPAECYKGDHPLHIYSGSDGCCRAEYIRALSNH